MNRRLVAVLALACLTAVAQDVPRDMKLTVVNPLVRVPIDQAVTGAETAELFAARGETESFQIVFTATDERVSRVKGESWALIRKEDGAAIHANNVVLYRETFVPLRNPAPGAPPPAGMVADALVPFQDPYTGEAIGEPVWQGKTVRRFGGGNFDIEPGRNTVLWVDVHVPADTGPGVYEGRLTFEDSRDRRYNGSVSADDEGKAKLPIRLTVWDFTLPPGPTHENHFGGFGNVAGYLKLDPGSSEFQAIEERYIEMMAAHRLNPPIPARLKPAVADDGTAQFSDELTAQWAEFVKRYNVTNIEVPRAPFSDILGADRQKAINFYRGWYAFLDKNGWATGAYHYMLDEPNDAEAYDQVRKLGALVAEGAPSLRRLVVEQPYLQDPTWGSIDEAVDIWCPLFGFIDEDAIKTVEAAGDDVWSYTALCQRAPDYHPHYETVKDWTPPFWEIDFPPISYRIATWINRRYYITGLLYWSTVYWGDPDRNPWDDPGFRGKFNGEGALFYPGNEVGIDGPVASIRLKNLRDGMEDYEFFKLLEAKSGPDAVLAIVREAAPDWGHPTYDPQKLLELRKRIGETLAAARRG
ncbi:MAG: DUF4091 domain-containing protein [Candidatus Hydrogenedentes bacterium]|nr:DUF4091 domain-containing protein [Candidatus Hydrogenedentota bacterium]